MLTWDSLEQRLRQLRTLNRAITWENFDGVPVASLPAKFKMPEIERYTGINCPRIHLRLYRVLETVAFNTVINISRRELEALRQRPEESVTSFISRWREKISQVIDRSPCMYRGGYTRGLWSESSPSNSKGKKPLGRQRLGDVGVIGSAAQPCYVAQFVVRPTTSYPIPKTQQTSAPFALEDTKAVFTTPPQPVPPLFSMDRHCAYHQGPGHETNCCTTLRHAIQDLIDQGVAHLGQPSVTTNPLPAHTTHDESESEPIVSDEIYEIGKVILSHRMSTPFRLVPEVASVQAATVESSIFPHYSVRTPFVFIPDVDEVQTPYVDVSQTPYVDDAHTPNVQARAIHSSLHQKVKFIHDGQIVTVQFVGDMFISFEPALQINHSDDDLFLAGFTFDEVQTLEMKDFCLDFVAMLFDQHDSTVVLNMMKNISYLPDMGLGRRQHEPSEFMAIPDHNVSFGLGFIPIKLQLSDGVPSISTSALVAPSAPDRISLMTLYFPDEIDKHGTFAEIGDILELASPFDLFGVSAIEVEGVSDFVDPPLSFDVLSGFLSCFDDVHDSSFMDLSIFEEFHLPQETLSVVDFGAVDQPMELRIGLDWIYLQMRGMATPSCSDCIWMFLHGPMRTCEKRDSKAAQRGILSMVEYPEWLANVVHVPKKDGKVRVCVDFRDLNKAEYSKILMALEDMEKTSFITEWRVTSGKLLGYMVSERGIKVDPDRSESSLTCLHRGQRERKSQPTVWDDQCQCAFERIREYLLSPLVLVPPIPGRPLLLYISVSDVDLGCMLAQLDDSRYCLALVWATRRLRHYMTDIPMHLISRLDPLRYLFDRPALIGRLMRWLVLLTEFDIHYVTQKSIRWSIVAYHLASLPISDGRAIDDDFPYEDVATVTSLSGWRMYFDGTTNHSEYGIGVLLISPHGDHIPRSIRLAFSDQHPATNNIIEYEACILGLETALELRIRQMEVFGDSNLVLRQIQGHWKIRDTEFDDGLPWYHDIYQFLRLDAYPEASTTKDKRALRQLAAPICDMWRDIIQMISRWDMPRVPDTRGPHSHATFRVICIDFTMAIFQYEVLTSLEDFAEVSNGHEFILVAIDYFTKWVEAVSYARLTSSGVASFIISHIICCYGVPHELIRIEKYISE
ncbi:hypothetical protein CK203_023919 [Vitis vinifera]|uniref:Uncharacterized protein n=1 Tax=Vitis vinifera TaxID=29760 RepID=A0A438JAG7_VITVI|nr:hypothetical protein CK203_023919 [Vitis vinifera]